MSDAPSRKDRLEFQQLCAECQRLESELRQFAADPASLERHWSQVWHAITTAKTLQARIAAVSGHRENLAREVRDMCEERWRIIASIND